MKKILLKSTDFNDAIEQCLGSLGVSGNFLLLPTETVYGFVCSWEDALARKNICLAKNRPGEKHFQMLAYDINMVKAFGGIISDRVEKIVKHFCPGPITIVIPSKKEETIGFRIPKHDFMLELIRKHRVPLAGTSANISGEPPVLSPDQILPKLTLQPDIIIDSGLFTSDSLPSTVIKIVDKKLELLREGAISLEEIEKTLNR